MYKSLQRKRNDESGFTLIELLIVIIILGILAAIVVVAVGGITDRGKNSACKADYKAVEIAQEAHYAKSNPPAYATDITALVEAKLLRDPPSATEYTITTDVTGKVFVGNVAGSGGCPA